MSHSIPSQNDVEETHAYVNLTKATIKEILQSTGGNLTSCENRLINRLLKETITRDEEAKRKELSAALLNRVVNMGNHAKNMTDLTTAITKELAITKDKMKDLKENKKAIKDMDSIMKQCDSDLHANFLLTLDQLLNEVHPERETTTTYEGYCQSLSSEKELLQSIEAEINK